MNTFRFAQVGWLHAIWIVLLLATLFVFLEFRGRSALDRMVSRLMQSRLVSRTSLARRLCSIALFTLSLLAMVLAMMRPQWGQTIQRMTRVDSQVMVCLDVSKSMLAEDVAPNRLDRAKAELDSLLSLMDDGQQVGLIAFAGKASVLCPMTTDFGFLRLVLNDALPSSVGLGGTRIGEAIRKAVDGFGEAGDLNRVVLLITDGEDHESFPMDMAKAAKERGIRIVSIGFGDEVGSKIEVTDPRTGVRSFIQDRDGNDVVSRLDGETLREIALETEGAYVPAGTGALDLESIYEKHIATLLRGTATDTQRIHRNEAYQWCVLASLLLMLLGLLTATPWALKTQAITRASDAVGAAAAKAAILLLAFHLVLGNSATVYSQVNEAVDEPPTEVVGTPTDSASEAAGDVGATDATDAVEPEDVSARELYNQGLVYVSTDMDRAERLLNRARDEAKLDGELRYRSLYNLGWVEVNRADALLAEQPQDALSRLELAAGRFRESIRVRPKSMEARHNLEIVSRRILELTDSLAKKDERDLAQRLDELIERERTTQSELGTLVQRVAAGVGTSNSTTVTEQFRAEFRRAAITQRQTIADLQKLSEDARRELDAIANKKPEEQEDAERLRAAQLTGVAQFVERSLQRMQKARALTRRVQGSRAFTRWSAALSDTKRARDQLRNPIEVLGVIAADANQLAQLTSVSAASKTLAESIPPVDATTDAPDPRSPLAAPAWLTQDYLHDSQAAMTERTAELTAMLTAATAQMDASQTPKLEVADEESESQDAEAAAQQAETKKLLEQISNAVPHLKNATNSFREADTQLADNANLAANEKQQEAIQSLGEAMEWFLDVRRLIERLYADQRVVTTKLTQKNVPAVAEDSGDGATIATDPARPDVDAPTNANGIAELAMDLDLEGESLLAAIAKNLQRCERLDGMFDDEVLKLNGGQPAVQGPATPNAPPPNPELERYQDAKQLLQLAVLDVETLRDNLAKLTSAEESDQPEGSGATMSADDVDLLLVETQQAATQSLAKIEELRRLFFSLIEHLRDTGRRQAQLLDETNELAGNLAQQKPQTMGPLGNRQTDLQQIADQIAKALAEQAEQAQQSGQPTQTPPNPQQQQQPMDPQMIEKLKRAGGLVDEAQQAMTTSATGLAEMAAQPSTPPDDQEDAPTRDFKPVLENQMTSLQKIAEALQLLDDQQQDQNQDQNQEQDQQDQQDQDQQEQEKEEQQQQEQQQQQQQKMGAEQLLQLIRDREAERRKDKQPMAIGSGGVEKDW